METRIEGLWEAPQSNWAVFHRTIRWDTIYIHP